MPLSESQKMTFLTLVKEKKDLLMGEFGTTLTKADKANGWQDVVRQCCQVYGFDPTGGRNWTYCRDGVWNNMRMTTLRKVDRNTKYAERGLPATTQLHRVDKLVLDILGGKETKADLRPISLPLLDTTMDEKKATCGPQIIKQPSAINVYRENPSVYERVTHQLLKTKENNINQLGVIKVKIEDVSESITETTNEEPSHTQSKTLSAPQLPIPTVPTVTLTSNRSIAEKRPKPPSTRNEMEEELHELKKTKLELEIEEKRLNCIHLQLINEKIELELITMRNNMDKT